MSEFIPVAKSGDIPPQSGRCFKVNGRGIGIFNLDGAFYAIDDMCTHAEASLAEGEVIGDEVLCPLHFATFNLKTGVCTGPPADEDVATYQLRVNGDDIEIALPAS